MEQKYVLVKLNTGETLIGSLIENQSEKYTTLENPFLYQIVSITNPFGMKMRDVLSFKKVFDFTDQTHIDFLNSSIISIVPANTLIINFYNKELNTLQKLQNQENKEQASSDNSQDSDPNSKLIAGNLNLNFNFDNPEDFQMFMENLQIGMDGLLDEIDEEMDIDDEEMDDMEDDVEPPAPKPPSKRKKAKNKLSPKKSFDLPFEKDGDPKDPKSWSNDPNDYL